MNNRVLCALSVLAGAAVSAAAADSIDGQWIVEKRDELAPGYIQLSLHRSESSGGRWMSSNKAEAGELRGLAPEMLNGQSGAARFEIVRPAGRFVCEGFFRNSKGAGSFEFQPSAAFRQEMRALGYSEISDNKVFALAIHKFDPNFVRELRAAGMGTPTLDQLIAMNIHGVTSQYIGELRALGYTVSSPDKLVALRIHGVTPQGIREIKSLGYENLEADKLVAMRIHGASPEFIRQVTAAGFSKVPVDQLITMRIHGVTPEYIRQMKARGINVSIEKMVQMRIHGID